MGNLTNQFESEGDSIVADAALELPPERSVVFYNDDTTTMEFVIDVLVSIFDKSNEEAERLMYLVHDQGSAVVGKYTYDVAVSRANLTVQIARKNGFPLRVEVE